MRVWLLNHFRLLLKIHNLIVAPSLVSIAAILTIINSDTATFGEIAPRQ